MKKRKKPMEAERAMAVSNVKGVRVRDRGARIRVQLGYYAMAIVPLSLIFVFSYIPMFGVLLAFMEYKPAKGFFGSEFVGLKHFKRFFSMADLTRALKNDIFFNVSEIILITVATGMIFALLLYEIKSRVGAKIFHTCMMVPGFLSWTVVSAALLMLLQPDNGFINTILVALGHEKINVYKNPDYWRPIINFCKIYKDAGGASMYYYAALMSVNTELFEAASLDGANRIRQIWHVSVPAMSKVLCITLIRSMGGLFSGSFSPMFELTFNSPMLYKKTLTMGILMYNGLGGGNYSFSTAVGLAQSVVGLILVLLSNHIVKMIDEENTLL